MAIQASPTPSGAAPDDWTSSGVFEVAPGVYRMPLPMPNDGLRAVNIYVIVDGDGLVIVDSGWAIPEAAQLLGEGIDSLDCSFADIRQFLVTHAHRDHYTQAVYVRREHGTPISLGAKEKANFEKIQDPTLSTLEPQLSHLRLCGALELVSKMEEHFAATQRPTNKSDWEDPDVWLEEGELNLVSGRTLDVIETPGHTRGHVVFVDRAISLLFAGDHVLPAITPSIGFEPALSPNPLGDFLGSLARVRAMPDCKLLAAHGPVTDSAHARIDQLIDFHGRRLDQTLVGVELGATTAFEVAKHLRWTRREKHLDDLDPFNQMLATAETGAHLDLLMAQGRLTRVLDNGVYHYHT